MLTLDLLRFRVHGDSISPIYIASTGGSRYVGLCAGLIEIFKSSVGTTLGELEADVEETLGSSPDYKVRRGLAKILHEYLTIDPPMSADCEELRKAVFTQAALMGPPSRTPDLIFSNSSTDKMTAIASSLNIPPERAHSMLYADLKENQVIRAFDSALTPGELIDRYNTALAQAMLYRATRAAVDVYDNYRKVFTHVKLAGLMHIIKPHQGGYRVHLNGPLSLFANVERYGIAMARVLPAVLKCERWTLAAKVNFGDGEKIFRLSPSDRLKSHYRDEPEFDSSAEEAFFHKFERNKKSKWKIEREGSVFDLGDMVMIPDFLFTHKDGRVVHLEIVGYWTPEYLRKKLEKLSLVRESNVVVAVPDYLNCSQDSFGGPVVHYKQRLLIKDVLPALESVARAPGE